MVRDHGRRGRGSARRWTRIVVLALGFWLVPALAHGGIPHYEVNWRLTEQDITRAIVDQMRMGVFPQRKTIVQGARTSALVLTAGSDKCPIKLRVFNSTDQAMWNIAVGVRPLRSDPGGKAAKEIHVPWLPANSETFVEFPCDAQRGAVPVVFPAIAGGVVLDKGVVEAMLSERVDFAVGYHELSWSEGHRDASIVASALELFNLDQQNDRALFDTFSRALLDEKRGEEELTAFLGTRSSVLDPAHVVAAAREGKLSISEIVVRDSMLKDCPHHATNLGRCADIIAATGPDAVAAIKPAFLASVTEILKSEAPSRATELGLRYRALGLDTAPVVASLCERVGRLGSTNAATEKEFIDAAAELQPDAPCVASARSRMWWRATRDGVMFVVLVSVLPIALFFYYRRRWRKVRKKLVGARPSSGPKRDSVGVIAGRLDAKVWQGGFGTTLDALVDSLKRDDSKEAGAAAEAITRVLSADAARVIDSVRRTAVAALEDGELQSFIAEIRGVHLYVLVFPGLHDGPQALHRYPAFADGWIKHVGRLRKVLGAGAGADAPIMSLIIFLRPDASSGTALCGYHGGGLHVLPASLLDRGEARSASARVRADRHEFILEPASP